MAQPAPAAPSGTPTPTRRADGAARRRAVARRRIVMVAVAVAVLGVGGYLLLRDGGSLDGIIPPIGGPDVEQFHFDNVRTSVSPLSDRPAKKLKGVGEEAGTEVAPVLEELIMQTYVDPGAWGDYGDAWDLFVDDAATQAEADVDVLTLGATAEDLYDALDAGPSTLRVVVLTDSKNQPIDAVAEVAFTATATLKDGSSTEITSDGSFFLTRDGDEWRIVAYDVQRNEDPGAGASGASGGAGASGAEGTT